jgi:CheY-like chemotaxis protein
MGPAQHRLIEQENVMSALRKVLVVDDDPVVGRSFERVLSDKGYAVITARDGPEALRKLAEVNFDVVFTDIRMPGMDGIEVAARVKERRPWVPVVIVTGYGSEANEARAKQVGVAGFLRKPLSPEMIEGSARETVLETQTAVVARDAVETVAAPEPAVREKVSRWKHFALLCAAPFIGLAFVLVGPFVALAALAWTAAKALAQRSGKAGVFVKNVALFLAAPFIGLAYVLAFPFIGAGMLAWHGGRALLKRPKTH